MFRRYLRFVRGVSANPPGRLGVILVTSSVLTYLALEIGQLLGLFGNAYSGLVTYLVFPPLFVIGLILIPIGWARLKRETGLDTEQLLEERFGEAETEESFIGARVVQTVGVLTLVNVLIMGMASARALTFMDTPDFCGTACHSVMNPEWVTYQNSPHARVACTECHVGEGAGALFESKMRGLYQVLSVNLGLYETPIPTPVHTLRPARETCEKCHWPEKFYGSHIETFVTHATDEASTPSYTTLSVKIDAGAKGTSSGVHWHVDEENEVRYASLGGGRQEMLWVEVRRPDGSFERFENTRLSAGGDEDFEKRTFDCVDCHNRATHIYEDPERVVDAALRLGRIDRSLPFIKREALAALRSGYADEAAAREGIAAGLHGFYRRHYPQEAGGWSSRIDEAVDVLRAAHARNVHSGMNIEWGAYKSHLGHRDPGFGCFRCHNPDLVSQSGRRISDDCTLCHSILANDSADRFQYLREPDPESPDSKMHAYLREEFLGSQDY